jgi:hypothetical protein
MFRTVLRRVGLAIGWAIAHVWHAFVIVASIVAVLCGVAVLAFIVLEGYALLTGQG